MKNREMRTVIRELRFSRRKVIIGVPQELVLAPAMLLIYSNNMMEGVNCHISLLADDARLFKKMHSAENCQV